MRKILELAAAVVVVLLQGACSPDGPTQTPLTAEASTTNSASAQSGRVDVHGTWAVRGTDPGIQSVMEYRPGGEFFSTIVQKGMPIVMLGKWMMTNNAITQIDTSILTADKRLNPVDNETNHILSWTANQMVIVGEWAGMTTVVERVDKQIYLGRNATSDSKVLENTLRRYLQSRR